jgi:predicted phage terminase large subunit-like protein
MRPARLPDFHFEPAAHHRLIGGELNRLTTAIRARHEDGDRSAISLPPGAAKSFYGSITWPTQLLAFDPTLKILCINAAERLADDFARRRRQIMLSPEWEDLAGTTLMPDARGLGFQGTKEGGGIYAFGAGATIQGIRADALVGDDLITGDEEAGSLAQLDKKWRWYKSEARPRLRRGGVELLIATRWALLDPIGRVLRLTEQGHENWRYLRIPMVADSDDDPLGRNIGERLWPEWFTARMVRDAQRTPAIFNTLYQQNPAVSEFSWVGFDHIHTRNKNVFPKNLTKYIGCDIALHVGTGDFTVFAVFGVDEHKRFYLIDLFRQQIDSKESPRKFLALCEEHQPRYAFIDNDNASIMWGQMVETEAAKQGVHSPLILSKMKNKDKEVRAARLRSLFLQDMIHIANEEWTQVVVREVAEFPDGRNDDIVDAMAVVAKELHKLSGPTVVRERKEEPIKGAFQYVDGAVMTTQTFEELGEKLSLGRNRGRI